MNITEEIKNLQSQLNRIEDKIESDNTNLLNLKTKKQECNKLQSKLKEINTRLISINNEINIFISNNKKKLLTEEKIFKDEKERINSKKQYLSQEYTYKLNELVNKIMELQSKILILNLNKQSLKDEIKKLNENKKYIRGKILNQVREKNIMIKKNKLRKEEINNLIIEKTRITNEINNYQERKYLINKEYYDYKKELDNINENISLLEKRKLLFSTSTFTNDENSDAQHLKVLIDMRKVLLEDKRKDPNKRYEELDKTIILQRKQIIKLDKMINSTNTKISTLSINNEKMPNNYKENKKKLVEIENQITQIKKDLAIENNNLLIIEEHLTEESICKEVEIELERCNTRWNKINERIETSNQEYKNKFTMEIKKLENEKRLLQNQLTLLQKLDFSAIDNREPIVEKNNELLNSIKGRIRFLKSKV